MFSQIKHYIKTLQSFGDSLHFNFSYRKFIVKFLKEFPLNFIRQSKNLFLLYSTLPLLCLFLRSSSSSLFLFWLIYFLIFSFFSFNILTSLFISFIFAKVVSKLFLHLFSPQKFLLLLLIGFFYNFLFSLHNNYFKRQLLLVFFQITKQIFYRQVYTVI